MNDEQAIRDLVTTWHRVTAKGDLSAILKLMAEDVVFLVAGQPPMRGRDAFASSFKEVLKHGRLETSGEIQEIQVNEQFAYCWTHLSVTMIPNTGSPKHRWGTLSRSSASRQTARGYCSATQIFFPRSPSN